MSKFLTAFLLMGACITVAAQGNDSTTNKTKSTTMIKTWVRGAK